MLLGIQGEASFGEEAVNVVPHSGEQLSRTSKIPAVASIGRIQIFDEEI
jgi:hypothetical protein